MEKLTNILARQSNSIPLTTDIELIEALAEVEIFWQEHRIGLEQLNVSSVLALLDEAQKDASFSAAVAELAPVSTTIGAAIDTVTGKLGKVPERYRKLLRPLVEFDEHEHGSNPGLVNWTLFDIGQQQAGNSKYGFDLGASATVEFEAGDAWPSPEDAMPDPLLRLSLAGLLKANASGTLPFNVGSLQIGTQNSASTEISYYLSHTPSHVSYAQAVAKGIAELPNPLSFESAWTSLIHSSLKGVIVKVGGSSSLDLEVGVTQGFTLAKEIKANVGLTVKAKAKYQGDYELVIRSQSAADGAPSIVVTIQRQSLAEGGLGMELGVEVDLKSLADRLRTILVAHEKLLSDLLEDYREFLSPGTYLRQRLATELSQEVNALVANEQLKSALNSGVAAALGQAADTNLAALQQLAEQSVTDALDSVGEVLTATIGVAARDVAEIAGKTLGLSSPLTQSVLLPAAERLVGMVQQKLADSVRSGSEAATNQLIKRLRKVGISVSQRGTAADQAFGGVRELIGRYEGLLKKLITATEDAVRTKVAAKLASEETKTSGHVIEVQATFQRNTPAAAAAFDTVLRGDFNEIVHLLREAPLDVHFNPALTSLTRFATAKKDTGFDLVFLGFEFGVHSIFNAEAQVTSDAAGNVYAQTKGTWTARRSTPREKREVQFIDAFQLSAARTTNNVALSLSIRHEDENLKRQELFAFLHSFENARLLPPETTRRTSDLLDQWQGMSTATSIKADVNLGLRLDPKSIAALMRLSERAGSNLSKGNLSSAARRRVFRIGLDALNTAEVYSLEETHASAKEIYRTHGVKTKQIDQLDYAGAVELLYGYVKNVYETSLNWAPPTSGGIISTVDDKLRRPKLHKAHRIHELCMGLTLLVESLGDIYESTPDPTGKTGWTEDHYVAAQKGLNACFSEWLRADKGFLWVMSDEAHPRTVAFVAALLDLCRANSIPDGPRLTLTMVRRSGNKKQSVTIV